MVAAFKAEKIGAMIWPEVAGVVALCTGHVVARAVDGAFALERPFRRFSDWVHVVALGTAGYCVATERAPDLSKAIFYADMGLLGSSFGDWIYGAAIGKRVAQVRARKLAERQIAAQQKSGAGAGIGGGNPKNLLLNNPLASTDQPPGYVVNDTKSGAGGGIGGG